MLQASELDLAIVCDSGCGPVFGGDIGLSGSNHRRVFTAITLGRAYTTDSGMDGERFFTDSFQLEVKEIEVFEIITSTPRHFKIRVFGDKPLKGTREPSF
jgi:hypothetical protein